MKNKKMWNIPLLKVFQKFFLHKSLQIHLDSFVIQNKMLSGMGLYKNYLKQFSASVDSPPHLTPFSCFCWTPPFSHVRICVVQNIVWKIPFFCILAKICCLNLISYALEFFSHSLSNPPPYLTAFAHYLLTPPPLRALPHICTAPIVIFCKIQNDAVTFEWADFITSCSTVTF